MKYNTVFVLVLVLAFEFVLSGCPTESSSNDDKRAELLGSWLKQGESEERIEVYEDATYDYRLKLDFTGDADDWGGILMAYDGTIVEWAIGPSSDPFRHKHTFTMVKGGTSIEVSGITFNHDEQDAFVFNGNYTRE
jgi:hypothetical protein